MGTDRADRWWGGAVIRTVPALLVLLACANKKKPPEPVVEEVVTTAPDTGTPVPEIPVAPPEPEWTAETIAAQVADAVTLLESKDPEQISEALRLLQEVESEAPEVVEITYNIGLAKLRSGDTPGATERFQAVTARDPTLGNAWLNLGAHAEDVGDLDGALNLYRTGLQNDEDNLGLAAGVVRALRKKGLHDEAITEAKAAVTRNANNVLVYNQLGLVYLELEDLDMAQFVYERALYVIQGSKDAKAVGADAEIRTNLGIVYRLQDRQLLARVELEKALEADPELVSALLQMTQVLIDNHDWETAEGLLTRALEKEPDNPAIHANLGIAYRGLGRTDEAEAEYKKALELDSGELDPYLNLVLLYSDHLRQFDQALATLDTYEAEGGPRGELVEEWRTNITKAKEKAERDAARRAREEERRKRREEEKRLLAEEEARAASGETETETPEDSTSEDGTPGTETPEGAAPTDGSTEDGSTSEGGMAPAGEPALEAGVGPEGAPSRGRRGARPKIRWRGEAPQACLRVTVSLPVTANPLVKKSPPVMTRLPAMTLPAGVRRLPLSPSLQTGATSGPRVGMLPAHLPKTRPAQGLQVRRFPGQRLLGQRLLGQQMLELPRRRLPARRWVCPARRSVPVGERIWSVPRTVSAVKPACQVRSVRVSVAWRTVTAAISSAASIRYAPMAAPRVARISGSSAGRNRESPIDVYPGALPALARAGRRAGPKEVPV